MELLLIARVARTTNRTLRSPSGGKEFVDEQAREQEEKVADEPDVRVDARMDRMEGLIGDIEARQHTLQAGQKTFLWAVGLIGAFVAAIIGGLVTLDLSRIFALGDRLATVETHTGQMTTALGFLSGDVSAIKADVRDLPEIKADVKALRADLQRVADAIGAEPSPKEEGKKSELLPR